MDKIFKHCTVVLEKRDVSKYRNNVVENDTKNSDGSRERNVPRDIFHENNSIAIGQCFEAEEEDEDDVIAVAGLVVITSSYLLTRNSSYGNNSTPRNRSIWVREWLEKRNTDGVYSKLLQELRYGDIAEQRLFRDFIRMTDELFDHLLDLVKPLIEKSNTKFREPIPAGERLALTLHYLSTGNSFRSLQYLFRIPQPTISIIIPDVLDAIWTVLKDQYVRVSHLLMIILFK